MDRPVDAAFKRRQYIKRIGITVGLTLLAVVGLRIVSGWIAPVVSRSSIRTAFVEAGRVEATLTASGTVVPEFEQTLSSPINTRVVKVLRQPGDALREGQPVVELDVSAVQLALERLDDQIALNRNSQAQLRLDSEKTLNDLQSRRRIKALQVEFYKGESIRTEAMFKEGLVSEADLRQARLEEEIAAVELQQLDESIRNNRAATDTQLQGLALELGILQKNKTETMNQLRLAVPAADRDGVLTWVLSEEGATVRRGDVIARIADLSSFRVRGAVSDIHASKIAAGMPVRVVINSTETLTGSIFNILPTIENGVVTLDIRLDDSTHPMLKSNLRVDVYIVTAFKDNTLRLERGPFAAGDGVHDVFVIRGDIAVRRPVRFGLAGFEHFEVLDGLEEGDEVIVSSMDALMHMDTVRVE